MHECGKQPVLKIGQVQGRKFFASFKTMFVHSAFVIAQKMTGHAVHDHEAVASFFEIFFIKCFSRLAEMRGKIICLIVRNKYHQAFAAIAAIGAIDEGRNGFIEMKNHLIYLIAVPFFHKHFETVVLGNFRRRKSSYPIKIGLDIWYFGFDGPKLSFRLR